MKKLFLAVSLGLSLLFVVSCAASSTATATEQFEDMVHIGNFNVGTTNKLILAASAANIRYSLSEPYGEGCSDPAQCLWDEGDTAFHIEKGKVAEFWQTWEALYCQNDSTNEMCPIEDN